MNRQSATTAMDETQRRRIRRTALLLGALALGIYVAFVASGVLGLRG